MIAENGLKRETEPRPTTVWVMRHGPTSWNLEKKVQGNVDTHILKDAILPYFQTIKASQIPQPNKILVTGFQRTRETADQLVRLRGWPALPIIVKAEFNERKWGIFEGKTHRQIGELLSEDPKTRLKYPNLLSLSDLSAILDAPGFKVEGGESMDEVRSRVEPAFLHLAEEYPGEELLLIAHAGVLLALGLDHHKVNECVLAKTNTKTSLTVSYLS